MPGTVLGAIWNDGQCRSNGAFSSKDYSSARKERIISLFLVEVF